MEFKLGGVPSERGWRGIRALSTQAESFSQKVTGLLHRREPRQRQTAEAFKSRSAVSLQTLCIRGQLVYTAP